MRFPKRFLVLFAIVAVVFLPVRAQAGPLLLFDVSDGKVLYAEDPDRLWYPASLTKIMTAYLVFEALKSGQLTLQSKLLSTENSAKEPPSKIGVAVGREISLGLGLKSLIIKSANDVAVMLAEAVSGTEEAFIGRMNATARRLGMTRTHFVNPNGLPIPGQVTTARDLARLAIAVMRDFPEHAHYWATPAMRIGKRRLRSYNSLLRNFEGADGIKTGFICDSGYNIVASASRNGRRLIAVVLGSTNPRDRAFRASMLLEHGFLTHAWKLRTRPSTIETMPLSTRSEEIVSIRRQIRGMCGNRVVRRRRARDARRKRLRANANSAEKKAAKPTAPTPGPPIALDGR